jgi:prepilin-type N-terminal cleavage/methylation domain-containing protein
MGLRTRNDESGFSLVEMMVVAGVVAIGASMAIVQTDISLSNFKANVAMRTMRAQFTKARALATTQRRNMTIVFTPPNQIQIVRQDVPSGTTVMSTTLIENGGTFHVFPGVPDTPDAFGNAADCDFGSATSIAFSPEGSLVNQAGVPVNGTVYLGNPNDIKTIRAVTVFGATGRVRGYRYNGVRWDIP